MKLTFTLQAAYTGATYVAGPFNISGKTSDNVTHELATGVTKTALAAGYDVDTVLETLTGGTITSTGICGTVQPWSIIQVPATATLSYNFAAGLYTFNMYPAIQDDVSITIANVDGHSGTNCNSAPEDTATLQGVVTLLANSTSITHDPGVSGWETLNHIKPANQITLVTYGSKTDGGTFTTPGGTVVTVVIDSSCQIYSH